MKPNGNVKAQDLSLPHDLEAERAVLGSILLDNACISSVLDIIDRNDFFSEAHRIVFGAMIGLFEAGRPIDAITLHEALERDGLLEKAGGISYLSGLTDGVPMSRSFPEAYGAIAREKALFRRLVNLGSNLTLGVQLARTLRLFSKAPK